MLPESKHTQGEGSLMSTNGKTNGNTNGNASGNANGKTNGSTNSKPKATRDPHPKISGTISFSPETVAYITNNTEGKVNGTPVKHKGVSLKMSSGKNTLLILDCYAEQVKTLNGGPPGSTTSYMLELEPVRYRYKVGKQYKWTTTKTYKIKGLKGWIRNAMVSTCANLGLEVCDTTSKEETKNGVELLSKFTHPLGSCSSSDSSNACLIQQIFGRLGKASRLTVFSKPLADIQHETAEPELEVQNVKIRVENRHARTASGITAQDFGEQFFSGNFQVELDVSELTLVELGLLMQSLPQLKALGRGVTAGYGKVHLQGITVVQTHEEWSYEWNEQLQMFPLTKLVRSNPVPELMTMAQDAWLQFLHSQFPDTYKLDKSLHEQLEKVMEVVV